MSKLSELKPLHEKGLALIYLREKEKRPIESGWTTQAKKSWDELENSHEPSYNVGVRLGEPSKLISGKYLGAIDCDVKSKSRKDITAMNDALRELGIDLKHAPIVMSGRGNGSKHIYVQTTQPMKPKKYRTSEHKVKVLMPGEKKEHTAKECELLTPEERKAGYRIRPAWEIGFMGTGQQTVLPPSTHPDTGMKYAWASPLLIKHVPTFQPEKFTKQDAHSHKDPSSVTAQLRNTKIVPFDLYASRLAHHWITTIEQGVEKGSRSEVVLGATLALCRAGLTDDQVLSVLSDPAHGISELAYERRGNRPGAIEWLKKYALDKARYETSPMRYFDNPPEKVVLSKKQQALQTEKLDVEKNQFLPDLEGKTNKPKATLRNVVHVLEEFMGGSLVAFNEFSNRPYFQKDTPYGGEKGKELADHDDLNLVHYIATHYRFEPSQDLCFKAHAFVARKYRFHPVRAYLESLEWDGVPRLDTWLRVALGAVGPSEYLKAVSRKVLVAGVKRVFEPGCKFDYVLVLEGFQGKGKSTALQLLASAPWFTDGLGDIYSKDVVDQMTGKWIIELGELASIRKAESEAVKAFLSRQVDRVRMSYGRRSEDYARQSIFVGSTNSAEYFNDETGNRRYWPVKVDEIDRKWIIKNRDQLWAEAVTRYELDEDVYMNREMEEVAAREQEKRFDVDDWEADIKKIIAKDPGGLFITTEIWRLINLTSANGHPTMQDTKRIGKIMHRLNYIRKNKRVEGTMTKIWLKRDF